MKLRSKGKLNTLNTASSRAVRGITGCGNNSVFIVHDIKGVNIIGLAQKNHNHNHTSPHGEVAVVGTQVTYECGWGENSINSAPNAQILSLRALAKQSSLLNNREDSLQYSRHSEGVKRPKNLKPSHSEPNNDLGVNIIGLAQKNLNYNHTSPYGEVAVVGTQVTYECGWGDNSLRGGCYADNY